MCVRFILAWLSETFAESADTFYPVYCLRRSDVDFFRGQEQSRAAEGR